MDTEIVVDGVNYIIWDKNDSTLTITTWESITETQ
jgi:hypothetical protein